MPAIYAHHSFGKKVYKRLPENLKDIARRYPVEYKAGLQGPDFLFFYNPLKQSNSYYQLGNKIHDGSAKKFLSYAAKILKITGLDSPEGAYIMGFICHFMLDSSCHGFVDAMVEETGQSHTEQETEFDRYMLQMDGMDPNRYPIYRLVNDSQELAAVMSVFYEGVSNVTVAVSQLNMKWIKRILWNPSNLKEAVLVKVTDVVLGDSEMKSHVMKHESNPECREVVRGLHERLKTAIPECVEAIGGFVDYLEEGKALSARFDRNFN